MDRLRKADLGPLIVLVVCLLAVWPFLSRPGMPQETDAELHIFRTAELSRLMQAGVLYPRWSPDFYFGYGYPLFNFYAPLGYYLGAILIQLLSVDAVLAVKLVFVLAGIGAGMGMYAFARRQWGSRAGLLAAVTYSLSPYLLYIDPYGRGVLAETLSLALFPWVLWSFQRISDRRPKRRAAGAAMMLGALVCAHNLMGMILSAVLLGWVIWQQLVKRSPQSADGPAHAHAPRLGLQLVALALGVGLTAFFWLPVALEQGAVQLGNLVSEGGHFDFRSHFVGLGELLRPSPLLDLGATEPKPAFNLGPAQWLMAVVGVSGLLLRRRTGWKGALFFAVAGLILLFLVLSLSEPIWSTVPLMPFIQFPWRLLGPLAACLALLAGIAVSDFGFLSTTRARDYAVGTGMMLAVLTALPLTYPQEWPERFGPTTAWAVTEIEMTGRWLGTTSGGDYVPVDVLVIPPPREQMLAALEWNEPVDRVNRATLRPGTQVQQVGSQPLEWTYQIDTEEPFLFRCFHFYFPGWVASVDGEPVPIEPAKPDGLITVWVPAGRHTLELAFRDTPVRQAGWIISGISLAAAIALVVATSRSTRAPGPARYRQEDRPLHWSLLLIAVLLLLFKLLMADALGWFRIQSEGTVVELAENKMHLLLGEEVLLLGYDWEPSEPGGQAGLTVYWKAVKPIPTNYQVFVHLRDESGAVVAQSDKLNPGDYPTHRWPQDRYIRDEHWLHIPEDLPPGEYRLAVGLWLMAEGVRLPVYDSQGADLGDSAFLEVIQY